MVTTQFLLRIQDKPGENAPNVTWGKFIAAAVLALLIGLSAVDVQRERLADVDQTLNRQQDKVQLDGRGKWAGYMRRSTKHDRDMAPEKTMKGG